MAVDIDTETRFEQGGQGNCEETGAGVGVEEVFDGFRVLVVVRGEGLLADVFGEAGEDRVVVLNKVSIPES